MAEPAYQSVEQNTYEWHRARLGIPTASRMKDLFTATFAVPKGGVNEVMRTYAAELAADLQSGLLLSKEEGAETFAMRRGHELEPVAADAYAFEFDANPQPAGFVQNHGAGCSPDRLIGEDGLLEIKCLFAKQHTKCAGDIAEGKCPKDYYVQCQAQAWICGRSWVDLYLYHPHLPSVRFRVEPDPEFHSLLAQQVEKVIELRDGFVTALEGKN